MKEGKYIQAYQFAVIISSALLLLFLLIAWYNAGRGQEWRHIQADYQDQCPGLVDSIAKISYANVAGGIHQYEIDDLNRTDRCITCHSGIENPYMEGMDQPYGFHPGSFLSDHPVEKYGCTICHGGQGRALNAKDAHGIETDTHWGHPLLSEPYIQSSCGQCHLSIFSDSENLAGTEIFRKGHEIFNREGCLGCHKARGVGGIVGPDLTEQGEKTALEYSFQNIRTDQTISNWLKEHFKDPEMISPGSQMLKIDLPEEDLDALTTFVLGLTKPDIAFEYFSIGALKEFKGNRKNMDGNRVFSMACSGCHGKEGAGKRYEEYETGVPAILGTDFLRVASSAYIQFTLFNGRSRRQMASWKSEISGLKEDELQQLIQYVRKNSSEKYSSTHVFKGRFLRRADEASGSVIYEKYCETCHGKDGVGGYAIAINNPDFLRNAKSEFLYNTLITGRENATMPSWANLKKDELYDLLKYIRSFQSYSPQRGFVRFEQQDVEDGKQKFHFLCSRCHGDAGQGQTGPAIINKDFLEVTSDRFLHNTISSGRRNTAMFGWSTDLYNDERLNVQDIGNIVAYMRQEGRKTQNYIYAGANPGDKTAGMLLFSEHCVACHGSNGEGVKAPALNNQELLSAASNGYLMATITIGRRDTEMPEWGRGDEDHPMLTAKEREDIVAFIRGWQRIHIRLN